MTLRCADSEFDATLSEGATKCCGPLYLTVWGCTDDAPDEFRIQIYERDPEKTCSIALPGNNEIVPRAVEVGDKWEFPKSWFTKDHDPTQYASVEIIAFESGTATLRICTGEDECPDHTTEAACSAAGCYWYDGACHSSPPPPTEPEEDPDPEVWDCITGQININSGTTKSRHTDDGKKYGIRIELLEVSPYGDNKAKISLEFRYDWNDPITWIALAPGQFKTYTDPDGVVWIVHVSQTTAAGIWSDARISVCYAEPAELPTPPIPVHPSWWDLLLASLRSANEDITAPITDLFTGGEIEGWTVEPFQCPICEQVFEGEGTELEYAEHLMSHIKAFEKAWFKK